MTDKFWHNLIDSALHTQDQEIDCGECVELLDQYVDLLVSGVDPAELLPEIEQHMTVCHCCHTEMNALLTAVRAATNSDEDEIREG